MSIKDLIQTSVKECKNIIFPDVCIHCSEKASNNFFCYSCMNFFDLLFEENSIVVKGINVPIIQCFENIGPVETFIKEIKALNLPALNKIAASYMLYQLTTSNIKDIDILVPLGEKKGAKKYNEIVAKELSKMIKTPVKKMFFETRVAMMQNTIFTKKTDLQGKKTLLLGVDFEKEDLEKALTLMIDTGFRKLSVISIV